MEQTIKSPATRAVAAIAEYLTERIDEQPPQPANSGANRRALVVEGTASSLRLCRHILKGSGFDVETASSGIAALTSARNHHPDLIMMDTQLRDVPGYEFINWLRATPALQMTPIIMLGGNPATIDIESTKLGAIAILQKPASALIIHRAIREAMKAK